MEDSDILPVAFLLLDVPYDIRLPCDELACFIIPKFDTPLLTLLLCHAVKNYLTIRFIARKPLHQPLQHKQYSWLLNPNDGERLPQEILYRAVNTSARIVVIQVNINIL